MSTSGKGFDPSAFRSAFDRMVATSLSRRRLMFSAAAAGLGAGLGWRGAFAQDPELPAYSAIPDALKGSGEVRIATAGGALGDAERKAMFEPFQELTGIKVVEVEGFSSAQIKTQVDSGAVQWDVVGFEYSNVLNLMKQGDYLEPIDYAIVSKDGILESQVHDHSIGYLVVGTVMCYRTDAFGGKAPGSYQDFWDLAGFPGPRNWMSGAMGIAPFIEGALLADGVAKDALYPLDVPRAFASLDRIKDDIVKFWESGAQSAQLMTDNETVMGVAWNGRVGPLEGQGVPVRISWNGAMLQVDNLAVPKGAPNVSNAMKFIAFALLPTSAARLSMLIPYGYTNKNADALVPADRHDMLPSSFVDQGFFYDSAWWGENTDKVIQAWADWSLG